MTDIIVIGSGVSGLSSALQSQQAGFKVSSITRDRPQNATSIAADLTVYPIRGQTLLLDSPQITQGYMNNHSFTYLFPRGDGLLISGVAEPNVWDLAIDARQSADILARCSQIKPSVAAARGLHQFVGLRPGRGCVRLAAERLDENRTVIHNYGHAGIGYTLSWGCAEEVRRLAQIRRRH